MKTALTIAGSDCSGGAGIQADIKTMTVHGVYAMSAITALTAQNTMGVSAISEVTPAFLAQQLDSIFTDIFPDSIKIGMVSSAALIDVIAEKLCFYNAKNIVLDPVMVATSGADLMQTNALGTLKEKLLSLATLTTPNIAEAETITKMKISDKCSMQSAAKKIGDTYNIAVLLKGGHSTDNADDLLYENGIFRWFEGKRIQNPNTHGTGCTLSSAIAANLALGFALEDAIHHAKEYLSGALAANLDLGRGSGPLNHCYQFKKSV